MVKMRLLELRIAQFFLCQEIFTKKRIFKKNGPIQSEWVLMKRTALTLTLVLLILITAIVVGILLVDLAGDEESVGKLYTFPVSVGEKTYIISVNTNWISAPEVYLPEFDSKYVCCDFRGPLRATVFFNITVPTDLIWGNISLVWKYYEQNADRYTLSNNGTHNSVQMTFYHTAVVEHFEIRGTEGVIP
jgi:hypothetical protein